MRITDLLKVDTILIDLNSTSKSSVIDELVNVLFESEVVEMQFY